MTRWRPTRAGIFNVWEYDDQIFEFGDGRLVLRGRNGSGKSNALALLFPFLFDGVMSATRMDPMGGGRSMRSLLLGRDDDGDGRTYRHDSGQGYVWMEFARNVDGTGVDGGATDYVTIGIGAKATQHRDAQAWFFVAPLRIGDDLQLAHDDVPLGRRELHERLGDAGRIFDTADDYRRAVDATLFGLGAARMRTLLDLLLTLRRPHLAGKLDTDHLSFALSSGLAELDPTLIADLARSFDDLDAMEDELAGVRGALDAVERFLPSYRLHLLRVARERAQRLVDVEERRRRTDRDLRRTERDLAVVSEEAAQLDGELVVNRHLQRDLQSEIETILASPAYRSAAALAEAERVAATVRSGADAAFRERDAASSRHTRDVERAERAAADLLARERELGEALDGWAVVASNTGIPGEPTGDDDFDPAAATAAITRRFAAVEEIETLADASTAAADAAQRAAVALDAANNERRAADDVATRAGERMEQSSAEYDAALATWSSEIDIALAAASATFIEPLATSTVWEPHDDVDRRERELERHVGELRQTAHVATERATRRRDDAQVALDELIAERAAVVADPNPGPPLDPTRPDSGSSGVPLYVCTDFAASVPAVDRAGLEAALEAAGLLDATVGGDSSSNALDAGITVSPPSGGAAAAGSPTLADILVAVPAGSVDVSTIETALRSIALDDGVVRLAADGSWRLGPLAGRFRKPQAEFIGHEARERRRAERLAALDEAIVDATATLERAGHEVDIAGSVEETLAGLAEARPSSAPLRRARTEHAGALALAAQRAADQDRAALSAAEANAAADAASSALHRRATAQALPVVKSDLRLVRDGLIEARQHRDTIVRCRERVASQRAAADEAASDALAAAEASSDAATRAEEAAAAADREQQRFERLRADVGPQARDAQERAQRARDALDEAGAEHDRLQQAVAKARANAATLAERRTTLAQRSGALAGEVAAAETAMAVVVSTEIAEVLSLDGVAESADLLAAACAVGADPTEVPDDATNAMERAYRHHLLDGLRAGHDPAMPKLDGIDLVRVGTADGDVPIGTLARRLREERDRLETLLTDREREIFETHLLARVADAVRGRLAEADHFEQTINAEMAKAPTSSGMTVELGWVIDTDDRAARDAVKAMRFEPEVMSPEQRESLRAFFGGQIAAQRAADPGASYVEVLSAALDYRSWHAFKFYVRAASGGRTEVTRQYFRGLSGGEAATVLHLPLFASAAAHYGAGSIDGPRLIALDEAFAGIDDDMRARLMGLLVQLDLDVLLTSHEFWGFYEQVPELVVYDLVRRPPTPGVFAQRLDWTST